ncbi:MAG: metallophosphoesterase [Bacillota bacterium]
MSVYAIGDLHLSFTEEIDNINNDKIKQYKPMGCFGERWEKHYLKIFKNWNDKVTEKDIVLIPGDISWAMKLKEVDPDFYFLEKLNGKKVIIKGNHDYWWQSISRVREKLPADCYALQYDSIQLGQIAIAGTRGWVVPNNDEFTEQDQKVYHREVNRLEMSLASIDNQYQKLIVMLHYMPVNSRHEKNEIIEKLVTHQVDICVYGHLHGKKAHKNRLTGNKWGIEFKLVSADFLDFEPQLIF